MSISIVIPNYNGRDLLPRTLPTIKKYSKNAEIIVVDDASNDDSIEIIRKEFPFIKLIQQTHNKGFSSTVNRGVEAAQGPLILLLNSDVSIEEDTIPHLLSHFKNELVFAVGCSQKSIEKGTTIYRGRGAGEFYRGFLIHNKGETLSDRTLWVSGGAGMFRKDLWTKIGGLETMYNPFYWEDIDLSYRAQKAGYLVKFEPKSQVTHYYDKGSIRQKYSPGYVKTIAYRNQILFVWLNISNYFFLLQHIFFLPYYILRSLMKLDIQFLQGFLMASLLLPKVLQKRHRNRRLRKKDDKEILPII